MDIVIWILAVVGVLAALLFGVQYTYLLRSRYKRRMEEHKKKILADERRKGYADASKETEKVRRELQERIRKLEQFIRDKGLYVPY